MAAGFAKTLFAARAGQACWRLRCQVTVDNRGLFCEGEALTEPETTLQQERYMTSTHVKTQVKPLSYRVANPTVPHSGAMAEALF